MHAISRSRRDERPVGVARGWIALGDRAFGAVVAIGNVAVGPLAMGGVAVGVVSLSLVAVGGFAAGALSVGAWSWGGLALGLHAAQGFVAVASRFADGIVSLAEHADDGAAEGFFGGALPYVLLDLFLESRVLVIAVTALLLLPALLLRLRRDR